MREQITVLVNGERVLAEKGETLARIAGVEKPCGGHGRCGKCKVWARGALSEVTDGERRLLSEGELSAGIRLACLARALGDCEIRTAELSESTRIVADGDLPAFEKAPAFKAYGVAIDIGTTTLASRLYGVSGELLAEASRLNPQQTWGADVISRVEASLGGATGELAKAIRAALDEMIAELALLAGVDCARFDGAVITGNTVMLTLFTEGSTEPFSHAPFAAKRLFGETLTAKELGLCSLLPETPVHLPPCISAFVGADTTCAILATELCRGGTAMLADVGTNGEMALWHGGRLTVCSTAAGPAFEGVGISMGMRGARGAIDRVEIVNGRPWAHVIGGGAPLGICGSGLVDAAAALLDLELLDESGYLEEETCVIEPPVVITLGDIRRLQLAKGAICAGLLTLATTEGVAHSAVSRLFVAGGFGKYLNMASAAKIGLLPSALARRATAVGNAALSGASMLLLNGELRKTAKTLAEGAAVLQLAESAVFRDAYIAAMAFEEI